MSSGTLPQASAGAALLGRAVLVPLDDASRPVLRHRTFPARFHRKCASGGFVSSPVCLPTNVLQKYHSGRAKGGTVRVVAPLLAVAAAAAVLTTAPPANPVKA